MHNAIDRGQRLDIEVLEKYIKHKFGNKYLKVALLRKYNNLKRTKEITQHLDQHEAQLKQQ